MERYAHELSIQLRDDLGSANRSRDDFWATPWPSHPSFRGNIHSFLGGSDGMNCGHHESLHHAKVVMDDLGQQGQGNKQLVVTGGTADNLEEVVIILMVHPHHKHEGISKRQR